MIRIRQIKIPVNIDSPSYLEKKISQKLKISNRDIIKYEISKRSIDARDKKNILYVYEVDVEIKNEGKVLDRINSSDIFSCVEEKYVFPTTINRLKDRPIIVGSGPAGLFSAYMLASVGFRPIVLERGDMMEDRINTVEKFFKDNKLDPQSNIQFGEGGAGTFSDGKLNTLTKDNLRSRKVFEIFVECGAPKDILYTHNPHIGTDILREVIVNMRNKIISMGGEFRYRSCVTDLITHKGVITGVVVNNQEKINSSHVILAIGHSARDTFKMLRNKHVSMKPKNFAIGVRVEHPRSMIDNWQYGDFAKKLGAASYKLTYQTKEGRGVYSFCMCPGGFVVNASSEEGRLVVNGMSNHDRCEKNSNSAIVVSVSPKDFGDDLFAGMAYQRLLEEKAYKLCGGVIPVQLYKDFCDNTKSSEFGKITPNTKGSYDFGNIRSILPKFVSDSIIEAMPEFGKKIKDFDRGDALFLGVETRTSSPVVIERDDNFESSVKGLFPCGEGAGYAGGITTAAIDGVKVAEKLVLSLK